jgi:hypothetical protein
MTYLVISCDRSQVPPKVVLDVASTPTADLALNQIANLRPNSDIIMAVTADQLRDFANSIEKITPLEINLLHSAIEKTS